MTLSYRILGPLEVTEGGRPVALGGSRQRAVLALLLTRANELVTADRLVADVWGDAASGTAGNTLQVVISRLRKILGRDALETRAGGYLLRVEADALDLTLFERLVQEGQRLLAGGQPQEAVDALRAALSLWRGPPLADVGFESFAQPEIARLEELRLAAIERRLEAELELGLDAELVGELEALAAAHPLRERIRGYLMLALYRAGRQADALEAYRAARVSLVETLGLEPGPALHELERRILAQDPALELSPDTAAVGAPEVDSPARVVLVSPGTDAAVDALLPLAERLAGEAVREVIVARIVAPHELESTSAFLETRCEAWRPQDVTVRVSAFTSSAAGADTARLASEQQAELVLTDAPESLAERGALDGELAVLLRDAPCDVAVAVHRGRAWVLPPDPLDVLVPFGGADHEWAAVELAAWIASSGDGGRLTLLGTDAAPEQGRRDASRLLARAALVAQRLTGVSTRPVLAPPGAAGIVDAAARSSLLVLGLSSRWAHEGLGDVRRDVVRDAPVPALLVRRGLRPSGLAPDRSLTRFTWTLATDVRP